MVMHPFHEEIAGPGLPPQTEVSSIFCENQAAMVQHETSLAGYFQDRIDAIIDQRVIGLRAFSVRYNGDVGIHQARSR
jgi:hypothetical protein